MAARTITALEYYRRQHHWSQRELHEASGVDQGTISRLETTQYDLDNLRVGTLEKLAAALGVSIQQLRDAAPLQETPHAEN